MLALQNAAEIVTQIPFFNYKKKKLIIKLRLMLVIDVLTSTLVARKRQVGANKIGSIHLSE
jgi:hypothetical protein